MVAICNNNDFGPKTLCDWVKDFRIKKIQMKRKRGDLRISAILATALHSAEHELRRKQQERFNRWLEMQAKFERKLGQAPGRARQTTEDEYYVKTASEGDDVSDEEECKRREEIENLWKSELSGLDEFMRNMSSSNCAVKVAS